MSLEEVRKLEMSNVKNVYEERPSEQTKCNEDGPPARELKEDEEAVIV